MPSRGRKAATSPSVSHGSLASSLGAYLSGTLRRPGDLAAAMVGQVGDVAGARCGNSGFDWRVWLFATPHTVEEILHVGDRSVLETL